MERISHWIGGKTVPGESGRTGTVFNPATGEQTHEVDFASTEEVGEAVAAAAEAFPAWRATSLSKRSDVMFQIRELLEDRKTEIAGAITAQHGKVLSDAMGEVQRGLENVEFACGIPNLLKGGFTEQASTGIDVYSIRQPLGVVAGITPFNFPAMVPLWMLTNAIACGNTFVLKPSEKDPGASLLLAELLRDAGVPDGVFNVVHGDKVAVDAILDHPDIKAVSFVGSTPIARYIYEHGTKAGKRVQALGGAKNHMIVLPDADLDMAADAAVSAGYGSAGERCMAISAIVAVGGIADDLVTKIADRLPKVKVGPGTDPEAEMGPLVTREHRDKVAGYLDSGAEQGATVVRDGREDAVYGGDGFFLGVSLLDHVTEGMDAYRDEIFGPVLSVVRVDTYDEALKMVNDNPYGNGVAIFTRDGGAVRQFQFDVNVGMVGVNVPIPVPVAYYSFGGWKSSLFGDNHMYGPEGIQFYTRGKVVTARWPDPATSAVDLGFPRTRRGRSGPGAPPWGGGGCSQLVRERPRVPQREMGWCGGGETGADPRYGDGRRGGSRRSLAGQERTLGRGVEVDAVPGGDVPRPRRSRGGAGSIDRAVRCHRRGGVVVQGRDVRPLPGAHGGGQPLRRQPQCA
jgi:malonate-semialdehyde dehydrogenase (acetylating) / methylmalonate-semialdehyde dehydrogenase